MRLYPSSKFPFSRLGDCGNIITGSTPSKEKSEYWDGHIPFITPVQLGFSEPITTATDFVTSEGANNGRTLPTGTVLICCIGSLGKVGVTGIPSICNQQINAIVFHKTMVDQQYGYHIAKQLKPILEHYAPSTTLKIIKKSLFADFEIPLPPLPEQKRIAAILDAADALRTQRRQSIAELDLLLQSTFLEMFGDPVENPKGWKNKTLNDILSVKSINGAYYPKEYYSENGTLMVHMSDAFYGTADTRNMKRVNVSENDIKKYRLCSTDLLISRRSLNYEGSAKPCFIPKINESIIFESSLIRLRPDLKKVCTEYLFYYLANDRAREKYVFPLVTKSTISGISQSNLMKVNVVVPPLELQEKFAGIAEAIEAQKERVQAHLAELDTLFASLQQRAFNGEL